MSMDNSVRHRSSPSVDCTNVDKQPLAVSTIRVRQDRHEERSIFLDALTHGLTNGLTNGLGHGQSHGLIHGQSRRLVVAMLSTFPPTQCGLATFATATLESLRKARPAWEFRRIAVADEPLPAADVSTWLKGNDESRNLAVEESNKCDVLLLQHEFGIFGGPDGSEILGFLRRVRIPVVAVLHTVLTNPTQDQRRIIAEVAHRAATVIVMSAEAKRRLVDIYDVTPSKISFIPHGAHPIQFRPPLTTNRRPVLLTWGLVGPGKGLERAIRAVGQLTERGIDVGYRVVGETHPNVRKHQGEQYRDSLRQLAISLGVSDRVFFESGYRSVHELGHIILDADIVLTPYCSRDQITSGVLSEAICAGKVVVATAFPHSIEALAHGVGFVVDQDDEAAMADTIENLVNKPTLTQQTAVRARRSGRTMLWSKVGDATADVLANSVVQSAANFRLPTMISAAQPLRITA